MISFLRVLWMSVGLTGAEQVPPEGEILWCVAWNEHALMCSHYNIFCVNLPKQSFGESMLLFRKRY